MFEHSFFEQKCPACHTLLENGQNRLVKNVDGDYSCSACKAALRLNPKVFTGFVLILPILMTTLPFLVAGMNMPSWLFLLSLISALAGMGVVVTHLNYVRK